jgi:arginine/ornithine N-succinyltransferase beta subunit
MAVLKKDMRTLNESFLVKLQADSSYKNHNVQALISNNSLTEFRCGLFDVTRFDSNYFINAEKMEFLKIKNTDTARLWIKK